MIPSETKEVNAALQAFKYLIPILDQYKFGWVVTGGFACYVYGVQRPITDIDIDINSSKDSVEFQKFLQEIKPFVTQPLIHFVDKNYDNYNVELTYEGQLIDICPMAELNIFNRASGVYELFYKDGFPKIEMVDFHGLQLPLLAKELIIKNKEMLVWKREADDHDILGLRTLIQ